MATLGTAGLVGYLAVGGKKASKDQGPPIQASSPDEEAFIRYSITFTQPLPCTGMLIASLRDFLKNAEATEKKQKH